MRGFFERADGSLRRVLLIESGPRETGELVLSRLYTHQNSDRAAQCDVLTCYAAAPDTFDAGRGALLSVHVPEAVSNRAAFVNDLAVRPYDAIVILCPGSGVLAKWKWAIAAKATSRLVIADEFGNWFFVSFQNLGQLTVLLVRRSNLASFPLLLIALAKILITPIVIAYLIFYAIAVHSRRWLRRKLPAS